jgi:hypothetical protein
MRSGKDLSEKITFELRSEEKELYKYVGQKAFQREGRASGEKGGERRKMRYE